MKITAVIGGITITIVVLATGILVGVAGLIVVLRYILPIALLVWAIKALVTLIFGVKEAAA